MVKGRAMLWITGMLVIAVAHTAGAEPVAPGAALPSKAPADARPAGASTGENAGPIERYRVFETALESERDYEHPFLDATVTFTFTAPSGKRHTRDAFWDGGRTWRVRFSPDDAGKWAWQSQCSDTANAGLHSQGGTFRCVPYRGDNPLYLHGPLRLSEDRFSFVHHDGTPFFWLGDTGWSGVLEAAPEDWEHYLRTRRTQGFSLIQVCATHWRRSYVDEAGETFYTAEGGLRIQPGFFQRVDDRFAAINRQGMMIASVILWEAKGDVPETNLPVDDIVRLARYIVARYDAYQIVWILGGDGAYFRGNRAEHWRRIGRGVFPGARDRLVTIHPSFWAANFFRDEPWHDFIGYQSGHGDSLQAIRRLTHGPPAEDWKTHPPQPVLNIEPCYEEITSYTRKRRFKAHHVRRALYWSLLIAPTAGITYGHNSVWQWHDGRDASKGYSLEDHDRSWREALHSDGAASVVHLNAFFRALPWWTLRPDQDMIVEQPWAEDAEKYVVAARSEAGALAVIYMPAGGALKLHTGSLVRPSAARWFHPRSGQWIAAGDVTGATLAVAPPDEEDWVLCIRP